VVIRITNGMAVSQFRLVITIEATGLRNVKADRGFEWSVAVPPTVRFASCSFPTLLCQLHGFNTAAWSR